MKIVGASVTVCPQCGEPIGLWGHICLTRTAGTGNTLGNSPTTPVEIHASGNFVISHGPYVPDEATCAECGSDSRMGMQLHNNYPEQNGFKFLGPGEWAHIECYIDRCAQRALERLAR